LNTALTLLPIRLRGEAEFLGLVISVVVLAANTHDNAAGIVLLDQVAEYTAGTVRKALVDQGFKNQVVVHGAGLGIDVEIVARNPQDKACEFLGACLTPNPGH
jgi:hypothetical protein